VIADIARDRRDRKGKSLPLITLITLIKKGNIPTVFPWPAAFVSFVVKGFSFLISVYQW